MGDGQGELEMDVQIKENEKINKSCERPMGDSRQKKWNREFQRRHYGRN
jgi:hypothetical protein